MKYIQTYSTITVKAEVTETIKHMSTEIYANAFKRLALYDQLLKTL